MIRKATENDLSRMLELCESARGIMRSDGNLTQWAGGYPGPEVLLADIARGNSYVVCHDGRVVGTFAFIVGPDPTYAEIFDGSWKDDLGTYGTIHRLASGPESHGVAAECFEYCWNMTHNLRVDTHRDNKIMQHCILKAGFEYCGIIHLLNGDPRLAYQKVAQA